MPLNDLSVLWLVHVFSKCGQDLIRLITRYAIKMMDVGCKVQVLRGLSVPTTWRVTRTNHPATPFVLLYELVLAHRFRLDIEVLEEVGHAGLPRMEQGVVGD